MQSKRPANNPADKMMFLARPFKSVPLPDLKVGDRVYVHDFYAEIVEKRDYPAKVEGHTTGADGPCSQIDLELISASSDHGESCYRFLASGNKNRLAMLQGNHLYSLPCEVVEPTREEIGDFAFSGSQHGRKSEIRIADDGYSVFLSNDETDDFQEFHGKAWGDAFYMAHTWLIRGAVINADETRNQESDSQGTD